MLFKIQEFPRCSGRTGLPSRSSERFFYLNAYSPAFAIAAARQSPLFAALRAKTGGAEGIRTPDLLIANQPLYQLSYDPSQFHEFLNSDYCAALRPDDKFFAGQ